MKSQVLSRKSAVILISISNAFVLFNNDYQFDYQTTRRIRNGILNNNYNDFQPGVNWLNDLIDTLKKLSFEYFPPSAQPVEQTFKGILSALRYYLKFDDLALVAVVDARVVEPQRVILEFLGTGDEALLEEVLMQAQEPDPGNLPPPEISEEEKQRLLEQARGAPFDELIRPLGELFDRLAPDIQEMLTLRLAQLVGFIIEKDGFKKVSVVDLILALERYLYDRLA